MALANYNPEDVFIILGGVYQLTGVASGSFITIAQDQDATSTNVTTDGYVNRTIRKNTTHTISITLASTADDNIIMSGWASADREIKSAFIPLFVKDSHGQTLFYSPLTWVQRVTDVEFAEGVSSRVWTLGSAHGSMVVGGNSTGVVDPSLASLGLLAADFAGVI